MNIENITNTVIYLDQLSELTVAGDIRQATRIIVKETDGATILDELHFAGFDGTIHLDLYHIFAPYAKPLVPGHEESLEESWSIPITISVDDKEFPFSLILLNQQASQRLSDIDYLRIPCHEIPFVALTPANEELTVWAESGSRQTKLTTIRRYQETTVNMLLFQLKDIPISSNGIFRLRGEIPDMPSLVSPVYQICSGQWHMYFFKNSLGYIEYFPMCGDFRIVPKYAVETAKYGNQYRKASIECDIILQQFSGHLTKSAFKALMKMLEIGYAFHFSGERWRRIVIEGVEASLSSNETLHGLSFTFRYQDPIDINQI